MSLTAKDSWGISVIIPNYNGEALLPIVLPTVMTALNNTKLDSEIIVVDDCSTDNSVNLLSSSYANIKLISNQTNLGFSPSVNKGFAQAKYALVLILNSDVQLSPDYFARQLPYFDDVDCFGVMGRIIGWNDNHIQDAAKYPSFHGVKIKTTGNYLTDPIITGDRLYSWYLSGANALVSNEKLTKLGGFDETFAPFYVEDFELSLRAWRMGWSCYYEHDSICRHKESVTIKSANKKAYIKTIYYRNKMLLHFIHLDRFKLLQWYLILLFELIFKTAIGQWYFTKAFKLFLERKNMARQSKVQFHALSNRMERDITVTNVADKILASLKAKSIRRF